MQPRTYYLLPVAVTLITAVSFAIAYQSAAWNLQVLEWMARAPHATLDAPIDGPAIYTGTLVGPPGRATTTGKPAAATWWWVHSTERKNSTTFCTEHHSTTLSLQANGRTVLLDFFGKDDDDVSLLADTREDWTGHAMIDLGASPSTQSPTLSGEAAKCAGPGRQISERWIPAGASVDVVACSKNGILGPCSGPMRGVLAVGGEPRHRARRAAQALLAPYRAGFFSTLALVAAVVLVARMRAKTAPITYAEKVTGEEEVS